MRPTQRRDARLPMLEALEARLFLDAEAIPATPHPVAAMAPAVLAAPLAQITVVSMEPDNTFATANSTTVGSVNTGTISPATDVDMFKFTVTATQCVSFSIQLPAGSSLDSFLRLFNSFGTQLTTAHGGTLELRFDKAGTYFIGVSGFPNTKYDPSNGGNTTAGSTGAYRLLIQNLVPVDNDPNDTLNTAIPTTVGTTATGNINTPTTVVIYSFNVNAGDQVAFQTTHSASASLNPFLRLFNAQGTQLTANNNGAPPGQAVGTDAFIQFTFSKAGQYFIGVSGSPNSHYDPLTGGGDVNDGTGLFGLQITNISISHDPGNTEATATDLPFGTTFADMITPGTDVDMFRFAVNPGDTVSFNLTSLGGLLNPALRIFSSAGFQADLKTGAGVLSHTFPIGGFYFAGISGVNNVAYNPLTGGSVTSGSTGSYTFTMNLVTRHNTLATALSLPVGNSTSGTISPGTDVDMYKFTANAGQTVSFNIDTPLGSTLNSYIRIFNRFGTQLAFNDNGAAPNEILLKDSFLTLTFTITGTYFIGVSGFPNTAYDPITGVGTVNGTTGTYTLFIT